MELLGYMAFTILAAGSVAGAVLLAFGLRGRKVDDFPYCRNCRYNLTGLSSERCPECGSLTAEVGVIIGRRRRRPKLIVAGLLLCAPTWAILIGAQTRWARSVKWYRKLPTWWVLRDARSTSEGRALRAFEELERRDRFGLLTPADRQARTDAMIVQFTRRDNPFDPSTEVEQKVARWLDNALDKGLLTPVQRMQVYDRLVWVTWRARPVASLEVGIPIELRITDYVYGLDKLRVELVAEQLSMSIDGSEPVAMLNTKGPLRDSMQGDGFDPPGPFRDRRDIVSGVAWGGWAPPTLKWDYARVWTVAASRPGAYEFRLTYTYSVLPLNSGKSETPKTPLYQRTRTIVTRSRVVATPPNQLVKTVRGLQIRQEMLSRIAPELVFRDQCYDPRPEAHGKREEDRNEDGESPCVGVEILADGPLPVGIAFRMTVEGAGERADHLYDDEENVGVRHEEEIVAAEAIMSKSCPDWSGHEHWFLSFWDDHPDRKTVNIVLTPDVQLAARSVDVTAICGETLRIENVPVDADYDAAMQRKHPDYERESAEPESAASESANSNASQPKN